jgi:hypothetical protein
MQKKYATLLFKMPVGQSERQGDSCKIYLHKCMEKGVVALLVFFFKWGKNYYFKITKGQCF